MVVSDVNMPGMSGHDLLAEVLRSYPGLPMMLITAYGQISDAVNAMQTGAIDYLVKPFEGAGGRCRKGGGCRCEAWPPR